MDKRRRSVDEDHKPDIIDGKEGNYSPKYNELPTISSLQNVDKDRNNDGSNVTTNVTLSVTTYSETSYKSSHVAHENKGFEHDKTDGVSKKEKVNLKQNPDDEISITEISKTDKRQSLMIIKNVLIISVAFTFLFTAYNAMANLQSSINDELGTTSLAVLYGALVVSCAFVPPLMISKLKVKVTMAISMLGYSAYIAAQFYPQYYTMIPGAILVGLGAAPMWSAKCTYLTEVGRKYAELTNQQTEVVVTRMFGIFFLFFQSTQVWGNLISSSVLSVDAETINATDPSLDYCGVNYCPGDDFGRGPINGTNSTIDDGNAISKNKLYTLSTIYLICSLLSIVIIMLFVDPLSNFVDYESNKEPATMKESVKLLGATFRHLLNPYQLLIIPLTVWSGVEQAFIQGDFTNAFISCGLGVHMVGYVMICYGLFDAFFSIAFSPLVKIVGRVPIFCIGCAANVAMIILFMIWEPHPDDREIFFIAAAIWGLADAVWQTQINALYGVIFPGQAEAAFSNYRMWESVGYIITFVTNSKICVIIKLYIVIGFLATGMAGYLAIEICEKYQLLPRDEDGKPKKITHYFK